MPCQPRRLFEGEPRPVLIFTKKKTGVSCGQRTFWYHLNSLIRTFSFIRIPFNKTSGWIVNVKSKMCNPAQSSLCSHPCWCVGILAYSFMLARHTGSDGSNYTPPMDLGPADQCTLLGEQQYKWVTPLYWASNLWVLQVECCNHYTHGSTRDSKV